MRSRTTGTATGDDGSGRSMLKRVLALLGLTLLAGYLLGRRRNERTWEAEEPADRGVTVDVRDGGEPSVPGESAVGEESEPGAEVPDAGEVRETPEPGEAADEGETDTAEETDGTDTDADTADGDGEDDEE